MGMDDNTKSLPLFLAALIAPLAAKAEAAYDVATENGAEVDGNVLAVETVLLALWNDSEVQIKYTTSLDKPLIVNLPSQFVQGE